MGVRGAVGSARRPRCALPGLVSFLQRSSLPSAAVCGAVRLWFKSQPRRSGLPSAVGPTVEAALERVVKVGVVVAEVVGLW